MSMLENYLEEVRSYLPTSARDDIVAELRDELISLAGAKAQGREPSKKEWEEVLLSYGHPAKVAAKYFEVKPLIGAELTGLFWIALKPSAMIVFGLNAILTVIRILSGQSAWQAIPQGVHSAVNGFLFAVGLMIVVFAVLEQFNVKLDIFGAWHPKKLKPVADKTKVSRSSSVFEMICSAIFVAWWLDVLPFQNLISTNRASVQLSLTSAWSTVYYPILIITVLEIARAGAQFFRAYKTPLLSTARIVLNIASLSVIAYLVQQTALVNIVVESGHIEKLTHTLSHAVYWLLYFVAFVQVCEIGSDVLWFLRRSKAQS